MVKRMKYRLSQQNTLTAADVVANNADLVIEILLRSPTESALKFKCVCKKWYFLISSQKFSVDQVKKNVTPSISGFYLSSIQELQDWDEPPIPVPFDISRRLPSLEFLENVRYPLKYEDSCSGLILCWFRRTFFSRRTYIICNPTTQMYKILPDVPENVFCANITYFPFEAVYKVVLCDRPEKNGWNISIYCSDSASWKLVRISNNQETTCNSTRTVFWNGAIHWLYGNTRGFFHNTFHVIEERFEATPVVQQIMELCSPYDIKYFGESGGNLLLVQTCDYTNTKFRILEMDKACNVWTMKYRFCLRNVFPISHKLIGYDYSILCVLKGDEGNDADIIVAASGKVLSFNLNSNIVKFLSRSPPKPVLGRLHVFLYQGSLAPV